jgi:formylglycine-generating enzyme required for sulfatase activity
MTPTPQAPQGRRLLSLALAAFVGVTATTAARANPAVDLPRMVDIPAGELQTLACPQLDRICDPQLDYVERTLKISAFKLAATEVTFEQWDACVKEGGCTAPASDWAFMNRPVHPPCVAGEVCQYPFDEGWGRGDRPVIHVSWTDVGKYIAWLNAKTGQTYRLPTSHEWEYAAFAGARTFHPWGAKLGKNKANCDGCGSRWGGRQTAPVGSFEPNRWGLHDMAGNVAEWVSTCVPPRTRGSQTCASYMYRGGAWSYEGKSLDLRVPAWVFGETRTAFIGFRVAQ